MTATHRPDRFGALGEPCRHVCCPDPADPFHRHQLDPLDCGACTELTHRAIQDARVTMVEYLDLLAGSVSGVDATVVMELSDSIREDRP